MDHVKIRDVKFVSTLLVLIVLIEQQQNRPENLKYSSENAVYLFTCKTCSKQYTGSTEDLRQRFSKYRYAHRNSLKGKKVKQESFTIHFAEKSCNSEDDWEVRGLLTTPIM